MHNIQRYLSWVPFVIFACFAWIVLTFVYGEVLWTAQDRSMFMFDRHILAETMSYVYGPIDYVGSLLTQLCVYPWLGALTLVIIWGLIYGISTDILGLPKSLNFVCLIPVVALFLQIVGIGYKIYCLDNPGFCFSSSLLILLCALVLWIIRRSLWRNKAAVKKDKIGRWTLIISIAAGAVASIVGWVGVYKDYAYLAEMRMVRAAENDDWDTVLAEADRSHYPTHAMVLLKNVALLNKGMLGERAFEYPSSGIDIKSNGLPIDETNIVLPLVYYNLGLSNYSTKWSVQKAVKYGYSNHYLKLLSRSAYASGEMAASDKYTSLLNSNPMYGDWNNRQPSELVSSLNRDRRENFLGGDEENYERFLVQYFCQHEITDNIPLLELMLTYAMIAKQPAYYWRAFDAYLDVIGEARVPKHFQEAYLLFNQYIPSTMKNLPSIDKEIEDRFADFQNNTKNSKYQQTYWWYFYHGRNI